MNERIHILERLKLPSRFEPLRDLVGASVVKILVDPGEEQAGIRRLVLGCRNANEGFFWPLFGRPGIGKTTLAQNLSYFFPQDFAPTLLYRGPISHDSLAEAVTSHREVLAADDQRIMPVNVDHREKDAPSDKELAVLKSFLRETISGSPNLVIWPTTDERVAREKQVTLLIVFPSESLDRGVLTEFTHGNEPGLLDGHALIKACPRRQIGRWWADRRGALTQTIFRTNARAFWVSPAATVAVLRRYGPGEVQRILGDMGIGARSPADIRSYLERSDLGKFLLGERESRYVTQGRPPTEARDALAFVGTDYGYHSAKDKVLNGAMAKGLGDLLAGLENLSEAERTIVAEAGTVHPLIPDTSLVSGREVTCIEFAWRSGDALASGNRSEVAAYILTKLKNYAVELGWVRD